MVNYLKIKIICKSLFGRNGGEKCHNSHRWLIFEEKHSAKSTPHYQLEKHFIKVTSVLFFLCFLANPVGLSEISNSCFHLNTVNKELPLETIFFDRPGDISCNKTSNLNLLLWTLIWTYKTSSGCPPFITSCLKTIFHALWYQTYS